MIETSISAAGAIVYWSPAEHSDGPLLDSGLTAAGFAAFTPEPRPPEAVLRDALEHVVSTPTLLVRPLEKGAKGFCIVEEKRGPQNEYEVLLTAQLYSDNSGARLHGVSSTGYQLILQNEPLIQDAYTKFKTAFRPAQVSAVLVKILTSLAGVRLRPQGAIYWLPQGTLDLWGKVTQAVEAAAFPGECTRTYMVRTLMDEATVRAVHDAIVDEARTQATEIDEDVASGQLGVRALNTRIQIAQNLRQKIRLYETILGKSLSELSQSVAKVETAASLAVLQASAEEDAA